MKEPGGSFAPPGPVVTAMSSGAQKVTRTPA
jgi:hypothetical protein